MKTTLEPGRSLSGRITVPGDKSISHRAVLIGALAAGVAEFRGLPEGEDVRSSVAAMRALGVDARTEADDGGGMRLRLAGTGLRGLRAPEGPVDCGNSGTTLRLLAGIVAGQSFETTLTGDRSLRRRPMRRIAEPLRAMGARVETSREDTAPLTIRGGDLRAVTHRPRVASAQVKSCVLLAGLYGDGTTAVVEPGISRDHTERMLAAMGARVRVEDDGPGRRVRVDPPGRPDELQPLTGGTGRIPGDVSSAAYWLVAATLLEGSRLELEGVGMNPTRAAVVERLRAWGAAIEVEPADDWHGEPRATLLARGTGTLTGGRVGAAEVPGLIDELPLLAVLAPFTRDGVEIRGAAELRVKESDRIGAVAAGLRALGAEVEEVPDGLAVAGDTGLEGGIVDAAGDHRIALSFAAVSVAARGPVTILGTEAAAVSYPGFFELLERRLQR